MSNDLNRCEFIGRLGKDPESRFLPSGNQVCSFSIASGQSWKDKNTGDKKEKTEWTQCEAFGKLAEICATYLKKGAQVYVSGRKETQEWEKDGVKKYMTKIIIDQMQMLGSKGDAPIAAAAPASSPEQIKKEFDDSMGEDIPF
jgi:single-strand DNA-binding protein